MAHKTGGILWYVGGWTSGCCGSDSGESIGEKRVDEEGLWLFIACFLIIDVECDRKDGLGEIEEKRIRSFYLL